MYSVYTYLIEELRHGNDVKGWFLTFATSHLNEEHECLGGVKTPCS